MSDSEEDGSCALCGAEFTARPYGYDDELFCSLKCASDQQENDESGGFFN